MIREVAVCFQSEEEVQIPTAGKEREYERHGGSQLEFCLREVYSGGTLECPVLQIQSICPQFCLQTVVIRTGETAEPFLGRKAMVFTCYRLVASLAVAREGRALRWGGRSEVRERRFCGRRTWYPPSRRCWRLYSSPPGGAKNQSRARYGW